VVGIAVLVTVPAPALEAQGQRAGGRPGGRGALPPPGPNMNQQQVQAWLDTYALVQAERELQLNEEQYPAFVTRLTRLQNIRRRQTGERRRLLNELIGLVQAGQSASESAIDQRLAALEALATRTSTELRQAYREIDTLLTPWQRGRFRLFEEQLERRKIELLTRIGRGGSG
jgi:hypothetical protein